jgi:hypothetical protein
MFIDSLHKSLPTFLTVIREKQSGGPLQAICANASSTARPVASFLGLAWQTSSGCTHPPWPRFSTSSGVHLVESTFADISATLVLPGKSLSFLQFSIELVPQLLFFLR